MAGSAEVDGRALSEACDLSGVSTMIDVGGGRGALMAAVLGAHPAMRGIILDLKAGLENTAAQLQAAGVAGRCEMLVGSFFDGVPGGGDAYVMRWILHDWDDGRADESLPPAPKRCPQVLDSW